MTELIANGVDEEEYAAVDSHREPGWLKTGRGDAAEMTSEPTAGTVSCDKQDAK